MRLLMISQDFPPETGGIQTYASAHAAGFSRDCDWFAAVAPEAPAGSGTDHELPYPVFRLPCANELLVFPLLFHLPRLLAEYQVDAVFHTQWQTVPASLAARRNGWRGKIVVAAHLRELLFNPYRLFPVAAPLFVRYRASVLRQADHFFPVSHYTAERLTRLGISPDAITVVPNGTDPSRFYPGESGDLRERMGLAGRRILLTITRLVPRKGVDLVLSTLPELITEFPDLHYLVVGDGPDGDRLKEIVRQMGLESCVTFAGPVPHRKVRDYYCLGDLFVMPARTLEPDIEGAGIVFLEANACGLPVIGSDSGGIPSVIDDGETGYVIPEGDVKVLKERLGELLKDQERARRMGVSGRLRVKERFNWDRCSRKLCRAIREVNGRNGTVYDGGEGWSAG